MCYFLIGSVEITGATEALPQGDSHQLIPRAENRRFQYLKGGGGRQCGGAHSKPDAKLGKKSSVMTTVPALGAGRPP